MGNKPGVKIPEDDRADLERRRARVADLRANRLLQHLTALEERARDAEQRLAAIMSSKAWRITLPLRWLSSAVQQSRGRTLAVAHPTPVNNSVDGGITSDAALPSAEASATWQVLIVDDNWPRPDRDAGSIEIINLVGCLQTIGFEVHFAVDQSRCGQVAADAAAAQAALTACGVLCHAFDDASAFDVFLQEVGPGFRLAVLCRVFCGALQFERLRAWCPDTRLMFNTIDLHYVRIAREAEMRGDAALAAAGLATKERETFLARECDATLVVSEAERVLLQAEVPEANVFTLPLARPLEVGGAPFESRSDIGFIGGFAHSPNLDAVRFFLDEIWPLVLESWPECRFSIVGADFPTELLEGRQGSVVYLGALPDVRPWFASLVMTVAPLRFGAGMKGKVVSSLAAGVPCVLTRIAAEGMGLRDGLTALVADDAPAFAAHILRLRGNGTLWHKLRDGGLAHVAAEFSPEAWQAKLCQALWTIGALPEHSVEGVRAVP